MATSGHNLSCASLVVILLVASIGVGLMPSALAEPKPRLGCDRPVFEFGVVANTETVEHTFVLRNDGDAPLLLGKVRTSCGCTTAKLNREVVEPGKTAELKTTFSLEGRSGEQTKSVFLDTNDHDSPFFRLDLHGKVYKEIEVIPREGAFFGKLTRKQTAEKEVRIVGNGATVFHIKKVELDSPAFAHELLTLTEGKEYLLKIRARVPRPAGDLAAVAKILTDHPRYAELPVNIVLTGSELSAIPRTVIVRPGALADPNYVRNVLIRSLADQDFSVKSVQKPFDSMEIKITKIRKGSYRLEITGFPQDRTVDGKAIRVITDVAECPVLEIPIRLVDDAAKIVPDASVPPEPNEAPAARAEPTPKK